TRGSAGSPREYRSSKRERPTLGRKRTRGSPLSGDGEVHRMPLNAAGHGCPQDGIRRLLRDAELPEALEVGDRDRCPAHYRFARASVRLGVHRLALVESITARDAVGPTEYDDQSLRLDVLVDVEEIGRI